MSIPCKMRPTGLESLPVGYTRLEYLENPGRQWIDTKVFPTRNTDFYVDFIIPAYKSRGFKVIFSAHIDGNYDIVYSSPTGQNPMLIRVPNGDATKPGLGTGWFKWYPGQRYIAQKKGYELFLNGELKDSKISIREFEAFKTIVLFVARYSNIDNDSFNLARLFSFVLSQENTPLRNFIPALDPSGRPCMFDAVTRRPFYNQGTGEFIAGMTAKQARHLAYLPATGGSLTVSLPLAAAFDEKVQNALTTASEKGWAITVQYRESELTTKNIEADFLESTGSQYILTEYYPTSQTIAKVDMLAVGFPEQPKGVLGNSVREDDTFRFFYKGGGTLDALFDYNKQRYIVEPVPQNTRFLLTLRNGAVQYDSLEVYSFQDNAGWSSESPLCLFISSSDYSFRGELRLFRATFYSGDTSSADFIPVLDSTGTPCMYDTVSGQNFYNANTEEGATPFTVGFDTTEKAAISLSKLPVTTAGELTVSLPAAAEDEASMVPEACRIAATRGWTIFPQYRED